MKEIYTLADLRTWKKSAKHPIRLGVFGHPVAHSLSPQMQNAALEQCKIDMRYARFQVEPGELGEALDLCRKHDFVGLNLTLPHKIAAMDLVDEVDANAKRAGGINTIKFEDGRLQGSNTDGKGFARAIREEFSVDLRDLRVLILGAGGASRAIALQCAREHCERMVIANRTFEKAKALSDDLREFFVGPKVLGPVPRLQAIPCEESALRFQMGHVDLIVNATPVGLDRRNTPPIPARILEPHLMIYDTIYTSERTPMVTAGLEAGARAVNGLSMLLHQGALAFEIWFDQEAPIAKMRKALSES